MGSGTRPRSRRWPGRTSLPRRALSPGPRCRCLDERLGSGPASSDARHGFAKRLSVHYISVFVVFMEHLRERDASQYSPGLGPARNLPSHDRGLLRCPEPTTFRRATRCHSRRLPPNRIPGHPTHASKNEFASPPRILTERIRSRVKPYQLACPKTTVPVREIARIDAVMRARTRSWCSVAVAAEAGLSWCNPEGRGESASKVTTPREHRCLRLPAMVSVTSTA